MNLECFLDPKSVTSAGIAGAGEANQGLFLFKKLLNSQQSVPKKMINITTARKIIRLVKIKRNLSKQRVISSIVMLYPSVAMKLD